MNDDHFLKRMFIDKDWKKESEKNIVNLMGFLALVAFGFVAYGVYEWVKGVGALEAATGVGQKSSEHLEHLGFFGSFLQGAVGSLWALAGFFIFFVAFLIQAWQFAEQRKQLAEQRQQFKIQTDSVTRQDFESRFFGLLDYHRQNVTEIGINEKTGRRVFVSLIREFRIVHEIVERICSSENPQYPKTKRLDLAYLAFYYGVGLNSTRILKDVADPDALFLVNQLVAELELIQSYARADDTERSGTKFAAEHTRLQKIYSEIRERILYVPFDGHQSRLGHYYRHMFQLVTFLDRKAPDNSQKEFAGIFRAQLTNHEQALLCLNALSSVGAPWVTRGYLVNYELIKNIPKSFFDPVKELDVKAQFPQITFEYERANDPARDTNP